MVSQRFDRQMQAYGRWKSALIDGIERYQRWLDGSKMGDAEDDLRIYEVLEALKGVEDAAQRKDIVSLGYVKDIEVTSDRTVIVIEMKTAAPPKANSQLAAAIRNFDIFHSSVGFTSGSPSGSGPATPPDRSDRPSWAIA